MSADREPVVESALGCVWGGAFVGLFVLACALAWNAFTTPPQGFAP